MVSFALMSVLMKIKLRLAKFPILHRLAAREKVTLALLRSFFLTSRDLLRRQGAPKNLQNRVL
jgi:hypothetical protein